MFVLGGAVTHLARLAIFLRSSATLWRAALTRTRVQQCAWVAIAFEYFGLPPRMMYFPPYFSTVEPASFLYSS